MHHTEIRPLTDSKQLKHIIHPQNLLLYHAQSHKWPRSESFIKRISWH